MSCCENDTGYTLLSCSKRYSYNIYEYGSKTIQYRIHTFVHYLRTLYSMRVTVHATSTVPVCDNSCCHTLGVREASRKTKNTVLYAVLTNYIKRQKFISMEVTNACNARESTKSTLKATKVC